MSLHRTFLGRKFILFVENAQQKGCTSEKKEKKNVTKKERARKKRERGVRGWRERGRGEEREPKIEPGHFVGDNIVRLSSTP